LDGEASDPSEESHLDSDGNPQVVPEGKLPPEEKLDLRPFPLNSDFVSQSVLSEELREEIYNRVVNGGKSVKIVSAELGVDMNRVGAVVRLKTIEKDWVKKV
jgi:hypothetical protein